MKVLVAYASRHGATKGIAERIAATLERRGLDVALRPAESAGQARDYDAFVIGSAAYMSHWLKEATNFVRRQREVLASRPVWLFSSGPIGTELVDAKGRLIAQGPSYGNQLMERIGAKFTRMPSIRKAIPAGDFRDWPKIEAWAEGIARELQLLGATVPADA